MAKRGKVLREPLTGTGLLIAEGRQYPFRLDGAWKSEAPPKPGLVVDVDFDAQGNVAGILVVPGCQLAKEQAELTGNRTTGERASAIAECALVHWFAAALLLLSWFCLTAISVEAPFAGTVELTFWQLLRNLSSSNFLQGLGGQISSGFNLYGCLALLAITGPFLHYLWKDRRAAVGGLLPLLFLLVVALLLRRNMDGFLANGNDGLYQDLPKQARQELMSAFSFGIGAYVSLLISVYFVFLSAKQFSGAKPKEKNIGQLQKAAA
ncbi:MAG TPA: hypothetical protein VMT53_01795 [Terriglobales bacterium]|nr:hypothetical protein [Terriglobales bacterium]